VEVAAKEGSGGRAGAEFEDLRREVEAVQRYLRDVERGPSQA